MSSCRAQGQLYIYLKKKGAWEYGRIYERIILK
jgi:hypothetical protein